MRPLRRNDEIVVKFVRVLIVLNLAYCVWQDANAYTVRVYSTQALYRNKYEMTQNKLATLKSNFLIVMKKKQTQKLLVCNF